MHGASSLLTIKVVFCHDGVATFEMPWFHASKIKSYAEVRARDGFDVFGSAVGSDGLLFVFIEILRKWLSIDHDVHNDVRNTWNDGHDTGDGCNDQWLKVE